MLLLYNVNYKTLLVLIHSVMFVQLVLMLVINVLKDIHYQLVSFVKKLLLVVMICTVMFALVVLICVITVLKDMSSLIFTFVKKLYHYNV